MYVRDLFDRMRMFLSHEVGLFELGSGIATVLWGLYMYFTNPLSTWRSLDLLLSYGDTKQWGMLDICIGVAQALICRALDKKWSRPWLRCGAAFLCSCLWGFNMASTALAPTETPPWVAPMIMLWLMNALLITRIFWRVPPGTR